MATYGLSIFNGELVLDFEVHYDAVDADDLNVYKMFKPVPAVSVLPDWFKRLKTSDDPEQDIDTVKQCRGVWDILSMGYMFLWNFDAEIFKNENGKLDIIKSRSKSVEDFQPHPPTQLSGYRDLNFESQAHGVQKVITPYRIKTPSGTSVMVIQPPYRPDLKTTIMPGIIDTDKFYGEFNILFTLNDIPSNRKIKIKAGTPLAQVIPFARQEWQLKFDKIDDNKKESAQLLSSNIQKFYQKLLWTRKVFRDERN
jgi:hypothetical protein